MAEPLRAVVRQLLSSAIWAEWGKESPVYGPFAIEPCLDSGGAYAATFRPISKAHGFAVVSDVSVRGSVPSLLMSCRPLAITGLVVAVIVDTFNLIIRRTSTHVRDEVLVGVPSGMHLDSYASISLIRRSALVVTAGQHSRPNNVLSIVFFARTAGAMRCHSCGLSIGAEATTATHSMLPQVVGANDRQIPAVTLAEPLRVPSGSSGVEENDQVIKSLSREVNSSWIGFWRGYAVLSHVSSELGSLVRGWRPLVTSVSLASHYPMKEAMV